MEPAGVAIGVVGLAGQLAKASLECYNIISDMKVVGAAHDAMLHELRTEGLRLKRWAEGWNFGDSARSRPRLDPRDYRYRYAVATLARIVAVFASIEGLQARYGVSATWMAYEEEGSSSGSGSAGLSIPWFSGLRREHSPSQALKVRRYEQIIPSRFRSKKDHKEVETRETLPAQTMSMIDPGELHLFENPTLLQNSQDLAEEVAQMNQTITKVQQSLSLFRKLQWVISDKTKFNNLIAQLRRYNDGLFDVLPEQLRLTFPVTNPEPPFKIPFQLSDHRRNPEFVGREYLLEDICRNIKEGEGKLNIVVLYGIGGVGKTQLALEYVYEHFREYSSTFWVNATSKQTTILGFTAIMQQLVEHYVMLVELPDYTHICRLLGMPGILNSEGTLAVEKIEAEKTISAVKRWFAAAENTNWLLSFDNLDDLESVDIESFLPSCGHGTVIITSRRQDYAWGKKALDVQEMKEMEAVHLLLKYAGLKYDALSLEDQQHAATIAKELGYLPLALEQAGAYIHAHQLSLTRYIRTYQTSLGPILSQKWTRGGGYKHSVFKTLEISFEAIQKAMPKAADLILLCGFLNNDDIWEELLYRGLEVAEGDLTANMRTLFSYSIAKRKGRDDSITIHPLVHSWARHRLDLQPELQKIKIKEAILLVASIIGAGSHYRNAEDWAIERRIMPHVEALIKNISKYLKALDGDTTNKVYQLANAYKHQGRFKEAEEVYNIALSGALESLGEDHPLAFTTAHCIAGVVGRQGKYDNSLEWYRRALAGREKVLGKDHVDTLTTLNNMAGVFKEQKKYDIALGMYERAFAGRAKSLGADHPDTLGTLQFMAEIYSRQGRFDKALELNSRALAGKERSLGMDHPSTLNTLNNMAVIYENQELYDKALELYEQALVGREQKIGDSHPDTLSTVYHIAKLYVKRGEDNTALEYYRRALAGCQSRLGMEHPETQEMMRQLIDLYERIHRPEEAENLHRCMA